MFQNSSFGFWLAGHEGVPGFAALAGNSCETGARRWIGNVDQVIAGRALDLSSGMLDGALQVLRAMRAFKFEFACRHEFRKHCALAYSYPEKPVPGISQARDNKAFAIQPFVDCRGEDGQLGVMEPHSANPFGRGDQVN